MKGMVIIIDGMADLPCSQLGGKTPLEAADIPNINFLAARGELGFMYSVKENFIPESDEAIVSIFGNELINSTRGQIEARGAGIKLTRGDLAFRANFATIDSETGGNIIDRRAGRTLTTQEAVVLSKALNAGIKLPCKFLFVPTIQHRGVLVLRGGMSDNISNTDISYYEQGKLKVNEKIKKCVSMDEEDNSAYTANAVNEFVSQAYKILDKHPVNEYRRKKGLMPANYLLLRGPGIEIPKLKQYKKWMGVNYMPLEIGFAELCGMKNYSFDYPNLKDMDVYDNLKEGLKRACEFAQTTLEKNYNKFDYAYIHFKETDVPGHDNKPGVKKEMIEHIDRTFFKFLKDFATKNGIKVVVTADHSTPCKLKAHSADPVPVLFYNSETPKEKKFNEKDALKGKLGKIKGMELLRKVGFAK